MLNKVQNFINKHQLLDNNRRYLVALSGGADSVCLLLILHKLGYAVEAAHCNFKLRGEESNRDEQFCIDLCKRQNIKIHLIHFDTREYAALKKISIEMAARDLRYRYFEQLCRDIDAAGICVGHHQDDSVETILLNLVRGTGIKGLTGIKPINGLIIRPLLVCSKEDINAYLKVEGATYITDSSNLVPDVMRNKIRLQELPLLREINPSVEHAIMQTASHLIETERVVEEAVETALSSVAFSHNRLTACGCLEIPLKVFLDFSSPAYLLFHVLSPLGFNSAQIKEINAGLATSVGRIWESAEYEITLDALSLVISRKDHKKALHKRFPEEGLYVVDSEHSIRITYINNVEAITSEELRRDPYTIYIDAAQAKFPLILRNVVNGDKFVPFGMTGVKLVSDFLTDLKKNRFEKRNQLLLTDATNLSLWLVGLRTDNRVRYTKKSTQVLKISYIETHNI